jgi:hypothetical protein
MRGKACNDQNTFKFSRPQHVCNFLLSAVALGRKPLDIDLRRGTIVKRWELAGSLELLVSFIHLI